MTVAEAPRRYTWADLQTMPEGWGQEIIDGELLVNAAPVTVHARIVRRLLRQLDAHLGDAGHGEVFVAPYSVVLDDENVVEPDVIYVGRERREVITPNSIRGAPDLVVEVLPPSTRRRDQTRKKALYARARVPLYLVVDPEADQVELYRFAGEGYGRPETVDAPGTLMVAELHGLVIELAALFA
jgi:Uma2 family endonuclease